MLSETQNGTAPPCPSPFNMAEYVLAAGTKTPDQIALSVLHLDHTEDYTYADLRAAILGTATGLLNLGLTPGNRVLMRLGNTVDFPITYLAAIAAGLIPIPTSAQLTTPEITKIGAELQPDLIIAEPDIALPDPQPFQLLNIDALRAMRTLPAASFETGDPNRPAYIIYTSGTAGKPRAVVHAHRAIWARRMMWDGWYGLKQTDRLLHAGAFNWTYTLGTGLMDPWAIGATALIPDQSVTVRHLPELLKTHKATIFAGAPGVYRQMLRHDVPDLPHLRHGLSAGEKLPPATRNDWTTKTSTQVYEAFGMSECSTFISSSPAHGAQDTALGYPQPGRHVAIIGPDGPVPHDTPGNIAIDAKDPGLMLGYLNAPEDTAAKYQGNWFLTGDTGSMSADGAITYLGRDDDMMNAGGFRVSPIEVESAMRHCPGITDCAATEVEIKPGTKVIAAFYTAPNPIPDDTLQQYAAENLARYKQPRLFVHRHNLPRGNNNKLLRKDLRDKFTIS